jgi:hypothetical protein
MAQALAQAQALANMGAEMRSNLNKGIINYEKVQKKASDY